MTDLAAAVRHLPAWAAPVAVGIVGAGACAALLVVDPNEPGSYAVCPFRALTGLDCPGCGTLRAIHALLGGDPGRAIAHNVLTVMLLPVLVLVWVQWLWSSARGQARLPSAPPWFGYGVAGVTAAFWIARNLPWSPLTWLASGGT